MLNIKRFSTALIAVLAISCSAVVIWALLPIKPDPDSADSAVVFANTASFNSHPLREAYFQYQGHDLHYIDTGTGDTVVFIHGFRAYWFAFIRQIQSLKKDYRAGAGR